MGATLHRDISGRGFAVFRRALWNGGAAKAQFRGFLKPRQAMRNRPDRP